MSTYRQQKSVNTIVLGYFFLIAQSDVEVVTQDQLVDAFRGYLGAVRVRMALDTLKSSNYVKDQMPTADDYNYGLTSTGYAKAEELYLKNPRGAIRTIAEKGLEAFFSSFVEKDDESGDSNVPASDRMVTISDNMAGYGEIISTVEAADEAVRGANDLQADERSWIRVHVSLGITLLKKGGKVLYSALKSLLFEPLEAALKESSQDGVKAAVTHALQALRTYLGIF